MNDELKKKFQRGCYPTGEDYAKLIELLETLSTQWSVVTKAEYDASHEMVNFIS